MQILVAMLLAVTMLLLITSSATSSRLASSGLASSGHGSSDNKTLYFLHLTSFTGGFIGSGSVTAVEMALERINSDPTVLPNYDLRPASVRDSQVRNRAYTIGY